MDIYVFDKSFSLLGIVDKFTSLIWKREFYKSGTFELHLFLPKLNNEASELINLLQKGHIIMKEDSPEEAAYIEDVTLDSTETETVKLSGFFIDNFLKDRIVWGMQSQTGTIEEVLKGFVFRNCIEPTNSNRVIPSLFLSGTRGIAAQASEVNSYGNLAELIEELAIKYDVGWRVLFDLANNQYVFDVFEGRDLSINQSINPQAIFSMEYENVLNQTYTNSDAGYKNMALIGGQGEGAARKLAILNDSISGFDRKELFVDADSIAQETENGDPISDAEYQQVLLEKGKSKLAELTKIQTFESGISVLSNLVYKQDFDLGDKVTIQNNRWGVTINTRITSVEEVYENNTTDFRVNFGSNIPTIIDKIKQRMR